MRGKGIHSITSFSVFRITPAYAGKRHRQDRRRAPEQDHPRLCGEKQQMQQLGDLSGGSPPPMRGKEQLRQFLFAAVGITPAYAGKSRQAMHHRKPVQDHPRLCGEKSPFRPPSHRQKGSPPPMRGKVLSKAQTEGSYRITPAYAGKSVTDAEEVTASEDHPRLCGEKRLSGKRCCFWCGSPPPMRGKGHPHIQPQLLEGITPAYAGKRYGRS